MSLVNLERARDTEYSAYLRSSQFPPNLLKPIWDRMYVSHQTLGAKLDLFGFTYHCTCNIFRLHADTSKPCVVPSKSVLPSPLSISARHSRVPFDALVSQPHTLPLLCYPHRHRLACHLRLSAGCKSQSHSTMSFGIVILTVSFL